MPDALRPRGSAGDPLRGARAENARSEPARAVVLHRFTPLYGALLGDWTHDFTSAVNSLRKSTWVNVPLLLHGQVIAPFERAAFVADFTNLMGNWGTDDVYINTDVTMTLSRLPAGHELGMQAQDHAASDGVAVSTTTIYHRSGALGTCIVTALANSHRQVDVASAYEQTHT